MFDQLQGLLDVLVNVRMTVARLESGGLWVHNPVAPTKECVKMMRELEAKHGPVKHIVVGSAAIEHKIYSGPFSKAFPNADVWLPPKNWTFPVDVPLETYVPFYPNGSPKTLPMQSLDGERNVPWADEIEHAVLHVGGIVAARFHRSVVRGHGVLPQAHQDGRAHRCDGKSESTGAAGVSG